MLFFVFDTHTPSFDLLRMIILRKTSIFQQITTIFALGQSSQIPWIHILKMLKLSFNSIQQGMTILKETSKIMQERPKFGSLRIETNLKIKLRTSYQSILNTQLVSIPLRVIIKHFLSKSDRKWRYLETSKTSKITQQQRYNEITVYSNRSLVNSKYASRLLISFNAHSGS